MTIIISLIVLIIMIIYIKIINKKSKDIEEKFFIKVAIIVLVISTLIFDFIFFFLTCACGFPLFSIPVLIFVFIALNINWIFLIQYVKDGKTEESIVLVLVILIILESVLSFGLSKVFPERYHDNFNIIVDYE